jgi:hypothetical protein
MDINFSTLQPVVPGQSVAGLHIPLNGSGGYEKLLGNLVA